MHILSDYALEYGVCKPKNGILRALSAITAILGIVAIIPAIAYRYFFFGIVGACLFTSIILEEIVKKREYTIRYEVDEEALTETKIGLDGKTSVLRTIEYRDIDTIGIDSTAKTDGNGVTIPEDTLGVEITIGGESAIYAFDKYMYAIVCAYKKK